MVTKILKQGKSARGSIDYNEDKVLRGEATPVMHCNMPDDTYDAIEDYILKPEENPAINGRAKNLGFHMTVCPGENDPIKGNEPLILGYIEEVMQRLGYDKQPYIVYRHNDIEREHYHIVGTRVKPDGHVVSKVNDRYVVRNAQRELAEKYGFVPGKGELTEELSVSETVKFYSLEERALVTDWCMNNGNYHLGEYSKKMFPMMIAGLRK